ncbi:hypothetical protein ATANTOWER_032104 [Ataeniobius toweri]|uniref:Secreted protein n=1 Tax=Ataeniobius toweri TaxID=208326 RepID=A0ABU7AUT8_9TELE|nr:hypothetical protein [Ataeniobius toweri]
MLLLLLVTGYRSYSAAHFPLNFKGSCVRESSCLCPGLLQVAEAEDWDSDPPHNQHRCTEASWVYSEAACKITLSSHRPCPSCYG